MSARLALTAAWLAGCVQRAALVQDVTIDGYDLVVDTCTEGAFGESCSTDRQPLPIALDAAPNAPRRATPDRLSNAALLTSAREALATCHDVTSAVCRCPRTAK